MATEESLRRPSAVVGILGQVVPAAVLHHNASLVIWTESIIDDLKFGIGVYSIDTQTVPAGSLGRYSAAVRPDRTEP